MFYSEKKLKDRIVSDCDKIDGYQTRLVKYIYDNPDDEIDFYLNNKQNKYIFICFDYFYFCSFWNIWIFFSGNSLWSLCFALSVFIFIIFLHLGAVFYKVY